MTDLIPLQTAYIRQSKDVKDNAWVGFNTEGEEIFELSGTFSPKQAMSYLHFARPFELEALNKGIRFGKEEAGRQYREHLEMAAAQMQSLMAENEKLATKILQFIEGA